MMAAEKDNFPVKMMARLPGVSRQGFYQWLARGPEPDPWAELKEAIDYVFTVDDKIVLEKFVAGTETTVAVLGNNELEALPVIEIVPLAADTYDFESKYAPGGCEHIIPARLPEDVTERLFDLAKRAHAALGCRGVSRTDFIVDEQGNPWILETNTLPGMTATSLLPDTASRVGMSYADLCTKLVNLALE